MIDIPDFETVGCLMGLKMTPTGPKPEMSVNIIEDKMKACSMEIDASFMQLFKALASCVVDVFTLERDLSRFLKKTGKLKNRYLKFDNLKKVTNYRKGPKWWRK
jgi:hypothetical protein